MKIAVICANGKAGRLIAKEALDRGLDVTAVVRGENRSAAGKAIVKDLFDLTAADLAGFDAVVDAFGAWTPDPIPQIPQAAGSLYVNKEHTVCVEDGPDFPDIFKPVSAAHGQTLALLRERKDVKWTYLCPAGDFQADGVHTGAYILGGEELSLNSRGESVISYADYAIAMVDELVSGKHVQERISAVGR